MNVRGAPAKLGESMEGYASKGSAHKAWGVAIGLSPWGST